MNFKRLLFSAAFVCIFSVSAVNYQDFQPKKTSRIRENTEWTITYSYGMNQKKQPRVLLIGDSICNQYQSEVNKKLSGKSTLSFWATSKCVTDPDYLKELDLILGMAPYSVISLNNGLHSFYTNRAEWIAAYRGAVRFIRAKCPDAILLLTTCTPVSRGDLRKESVIEMNKAVLEIAKKEKLGIVDLYAVIDPMEKSKWSDGIHFHRNAVVKMAETMNDSIMGVLKKGNKK